MDTTLVSTFLNQIGLVAVKVPRFTQPSFIDGVRIDGGKLFFDDTARASGLLHEAGHVAITPGCYRHLLSGNLDSSFRKIFRLAECHHPESPISMALLQCSDVEATAWAYAAGMHLGMPPWQIIQDDEHDGDGPHIRLCLRLRSYLGVHGLHYAEMCHMKRYPEMDRWVQRDFQQSP